MVRLPSLLLPAVLALLLSACSGETMLSGPPADCVGDDDDSAVPEDLFPEFDGATLAVWSPLPAGIFYLDEGIELDGEVLDADGEELDFEEIVWELDGEDEPVFVGRQGDVEIEPGIRTLTVTADLPNGDRLQTVLGGIRMQGRHTGIYSGNFALNIHAEYQGTPITASCLGGLDFVVQMDGHTITGENGQCTINLVIMGEMNVSYGIEGDIDDGAVAGDIQLDLGFFDLPVGYEGEIDDGEMSAGYSGSAILFDFDGTIQAHRLTPYVDP